MRTLVAGSFVGEFGWELMAWQGIIRAFARRYDRAVAISRPEQAYLQRDICAGMDPLYTPVCIITRGGWRPEVPTVLAQVRRLASQDREPPVLVE